ncbi:MAG: bifunctional DNA-formamidopyrimidine glycosylase/DNA-(apurinic or apyrimidinic site) lyase [bacterium]|nr:bifunctional DNA-formamidopyrimidine glycosylase/DNA-(apurinic or apyrimidinic site) lyase [bacterium]
MPELPEVQTVVNDLNKKIKGKIVSDVWTDAPKLIKDHLKPGLRLSDHELPKAKRNFLKFKKDLIGEKVKEAERKGKNILIHFQSGKTLLVHQKMTGHLLFGKWEIAKQQVASSKKQLVSKKQAPERAIPIWPKEVVNDPYNGFIHLIITFIDGKQLALSDMRKFAKAILAKKEDILKLPDIQGLGPDALSSKLTFKKFKTIISKSGPTIKQALLRPELIAGIGNIYADESLWKAQIHPRQNPKELSDKELKRLYSAIRSILKKAIKLRGSSISDFRDTAGKEGRYGDVRLVYQREKKNCQRCQNPIKRIRLGGRSAHFCLACQSVKEGRMYSPKSSKKINRARSL